MTTPEPFTYRGGRVDPGETATLRYTVTETYLGEPVRIPVTIVNGQQAGPTLFLAAAVHGDELNGVETVRTVAHDWDHSTLQGTLVCLPILNVLSFLAQERYLPVYDRDLNRVFPGKAGGTNASRIAHTIFENFIAPCDVGIDFHTSTRGRTNMLHVRADMASAEVARLANAFGSHVVIDSEGSAGTLRHEATAAGIPTIAVEMGEAHRFQRAFIDRALEGVRSVCVEFGLFPAGAVTWPGWRTVIDSTEEKTWIRADAGGIVEMHADRGAVVAEGERIATIADPFNTETSTVSAPFAGLLVGVLENPVVYPGNPLCHLVELDDATRRTLSRLDPTEAGWDGGEGSYSQGTDRS